MHFQPQYFDDDIVCILYNFVAVVCLNVLITRLLFSPLKKYNFGYFFKATQLKKTDFPRINLNKIMQKTIHNKKISVTRRYSTCPILGVIEGQFPRAVKSPKTVQSSRSDSCGRNPQMYISV